MFQHPNRLTQLDSVDCFSYETIVVHDGNRLDLLPLPSAALLAFFPLGEWKGPWSDGDEKWTDEIKEALQVVDKAELTQINNLKVET